MRPAHYTDDDTEPIKVIVNEELPFELANAVKYIARCNHKGTKRKDLKKAVHYLELYRNRKKPTDPEKLAEAWGISQNLKLALCNILDRCPNNAIYYLEDEMKTI
jgi:hypothetical protein